MSCPVYLRYATDEMKKIFSEEAKIERWLRVEAVLAEAQAELGIIPKEAAMEISKKANLKYVSIDRIKEIEKKIDHDLLAVVNALSEVCENNYGRYVHKGATSYDIEDTAWALAFSQSLGIIKGKIANFIKILLEKADEYKELACIGRTHGQHALPTTYGMKFTLWAYDMLRCLKRVEFLENNNIIGKMSGAVGTMAGFGEKGMELQNLVMEKLGIKPSLVSNQVVQRDIFADFIYVNSIIAANLEKIAKEIRNLQRTEIAEVQEPFLEHQAGSSTMPHKRNPHRSERICSLARYLRSLVNVSIENIALEHERDLTNSANERIIIAHSFILTDYILNEIIDILKNLRVNEKNITRNLNLLHGINLSENVMLRLVEKGLPRDLAYKIVRDTAIKSYESDLNFEDELLKNEYIRSLLTREELKILLNPKNYLGLAKEIVNHAIQEINSQLN